MRLKLNVTYGVQQVQLAATVPAVAAVDDTRVSCVISDTFGEENVVPDVDRYRLRRQQGQIVLHPHTVREVCSDSNNFCDILPTESNCYDKTIVVVLESPHKDEYENSATPSGVGQPIAPAQGETGTRIWDLFDRVLRSCPTLCGQLEEHTRVVISNPVPFQTSLVSVISIPPSGCDRRSNARRKREEKKLRDAVWGALWEYRAIQDDFQTRLESYCPDFIINACTHDVGCYLRRCVTNSRCKKHKIRTFLNRHFDVSSRYEVDHPSAWNGDTQLRPASRSYENT